MLLERMEKDREEQEREARQYREDLGMLLETGEGFRFFFSLISSLGAGKMTATDADQTMKNIAEQLLDDAAGANPQAYLALMGRLRGIMQGDYNAR